MLTGLKKIITRKRFIGVGIILLLLIVLSNCGSAEKTVKNGTLKLDPNIKISNVFKDYSYFNSVNWEKFEDSAGRSIVQVIGNVDMDKMFTVEFQEEKYEILSGELLNEFITGLAQDVILNGIQFEGNLKEMEALNDVLEAGNGKTDLKKNNAQYLVQFTMMNKDEFRISYSEFKITLYLEGMTEPVSYTSVEGQSYPYLQKLYLNQSFMDW